MADFDNNTKLGREASDRKYRSDATQQQPQERKVLTFEMLEPEEVSRFSKPHMSRGDVERLLGFRPRNLDSYRRAFVHKSILRILRLFPQGIVPAYMFESNERLEFVGDAVLSNITALYLYKKFPDKDEGFLTKVRSKLVDTKALSNYARKRDMGKHMLMSLHMIKMEGMKSDKMLENIMESFIGAIYIDLGMDHATKFVHDMFNDMTDWDYVLTDTNYKDQILRYCQTNKLELPVYEVSKTDGPPHDRTFEVKIVVGGRTLGIGSGKKKTDAEQKAAQQGINNLNK